MGGLERAKNLVILVWGLVGNSRKGLNIIVHSHHWMWVHWIGNIWCWVTLHGAVLYHCLSGDSRCNLLISILLYTKGTKNVFCKNKHYVGMVQCLQDGGLKYIKSICHMYCGMCYNATVCYNVMSVLFDVYRWPKSVRSAKQSLVHIHVWSAVCLMMMYKRSSFTATSVGYAVWEEERTSSTVTPVATAWTSNWRDHTKLATNIIVLLLVFLETVQYFTLCEACLWTAFADIMHMYWVLED